MYLYNYSTEIKNWNNYCAFLCRISAPKRAPDDALSTDCFLPILRFQPQEFRLESPLVPLPLADFCATCRRAWLWPAS